MQKKPHKYPVNELARYGWNARAAFTDGICPGAFGQSVQYRPGKFATLVGYHGGAREYPYIAQVDSQSDRLIKITKESVREVYPLGIKLANADWGVGFEYPRPQISLTPCERGNKADIPHLMPDEANPNGAINDSINDFIGMEL